MLTGQSVSTWFSAKEIEEFVEAGFFIEKETGGYMISQLAISTWTILLMRHGDKGITYDNLFELITPREYA